MLLAALVINLFSRLLLPTHAMDTIFKTSYEQLLQIVVKFTSFGELSDRSHIEFLPTTCNMVLSAKFPPFLVSSGPPIVVNFTAIRKCFEYPAPTTVAQA